MSLCIATHLPSYSPKCFWKILKRFQAVVFTSNLQRKKRTNLLHCSVGISKGPVREGSIPGGWCGERNIYLPFYLHSAERYAAGSFCQKKKKSHDLWTHGCHMLVGSTFSVFSVKKVFQIETKSVQDTSVVGYSLLWFAAVSWGLPHILCCVDSGSGHSGLKGSSLGELSSDQDASFWSAQLVVLRACQTHTSVVQPKKRVLSGLNFRSRTDSKNRSDSWVLACFFSEDTTSEGSSITFGERKGRDSAQLRLKTSSLKSNFWLCTSAVWGSVTSACCFYDQEMFSPSGHWSKSSVLLFGFKFSPPCPEWDSFAVTLTQRTSPFCPEGMLQLAFVGCFNPCLFCGWAFPDFSCIIVAVWWLQVLVLLGIFWLFSVSNISGKTKMFQTKSHRIPQICRVSPWGIQTFVMWPLV